MSNSLKPESKESGRDQRDTQVSRARGLCFLFLHSGGSSTVRPWVDDSGRALRRVILEVWEDVLVKGDSLSDDSHCLTVGHFNSQGKTG